MPIIDPEQRLRVVVGVVGNLRGKYLVQQRPQGKPCPGQWEFPGGKVEPDESVQHALERELSEELGITVLESVELTTLCHDYDHARVKLEVFIVNRFAGSPAGLEGQEIRWCSLSEIGELNVLEAVYPILDELLRFHSRV